MAVVKYAPGEDARTVSVHRRFRRVTRPALPFLPWGLVPIGLLAAALGFALFPFARGTVEAVARDAAQDELARAGMEWASVEVSGQIATLRGAPPSAGAAEQARRLVREARAQTWAGPLRPVLWVRDLLDPPPPVWLDWRFRLEGGDLVLTGTMPDAATVDAVAAAANKRIAPPRVTGVRSELVVGTEAGVAASAEAMLGVALRGVETVTACDRGEAAFEVGVFSLKCELPAAALDAVRVVAGRPLDVGVVGELALLSNEAIRSCEDELSSLLEGATIEFELNSADVRSANGPLLDRIAAVGRDCPGRLRVEGHTDSVGQAAYNLALSQRRADSVRTELIARGVPEDRLVAVGFGDQRPKVGGHRPSSLARNRRIEIRVVRSTE
jgi:outer membrane protein OmpA-like peptidoglycan-associated protein